MKTTPKNYIVSFYKKTDDGNKPNEYLGQVEVDDNGIHQNLTLVAKAFRHATEKCALADIVNVQAA